MKRKSSEYALLSGLFFRLLPYQVLLIVINAVNGIADSLYASNAIENGKAAMSAIGLFGPLNHFLYAASMMFVSGSQMLYGRYLARDRQKIHSLFTVNLVISGGLALLASLLLVLAVFTGATRVFVSVEPDLQMLNDYILGQAVGIPAPILGQQLFSFLSLENQKKRTELWKWLKENHPATFRRMRYRSSNVVFLLPGKVGRDIDLFFYKWIRKIYKFN